MTPIIEGITHLAAIGFYIAALTMGFMAHYRAKIWVRKWSSVGIIVTSMGWLIFYFTVVNWDFTQVHTSVLWSRIFHYNTATWLFIMAYLIWRSEKSHQFDRIETYVNGDHA